jgi:hypothetical protein
LYGAEDQIDSKRLVDLADGFSTYATTSKTANQLDTQTSDSLMLAPNGNTLINNTQRPTTVAERKNKLAATEATVTLAKDSADILLSREGSLVQTLLLEESVRATSAQVKDDVRNLLVDGPRRFRESVPFGALLPPLPFEEQLSPFVGKTEEEIRAQQLAKKLISLVSQQQRHRIRGPGNSNEPVNGSPLSTPPAALRALIGDVEPEQLAILSRELRMSAPKYLPLVGVLGAKFTSSLLEAASNNIDTALASGGNADGLTKVTARSLSRIARQGADTISEGIVNNNPPQE